MILNKNEPLFQDLFDPNVFLGPGFKVIIVVLRGSLPTS